MHRGHMRHRRRRWTAVAAGVLVALSTACAGGGPEAGGGGVPTEAPDVRLVAALQPFDDCPAVLKWFQDEALERVGPYGLGDPSDDTMGPTAAAGAESTTDGARRRAAPAPPRALSSGPSPNAGVAAGDSSGSPAAGSGSAGTPGFSTTNVQEAGVDEPDAVKTDGRRLVSVAGDELRVVDLTGPSPALAGRVDLPGAAHYETVVFLHGDRVLAIGHESNVIALPTVPGDVMPRRGGYAREGTRLSLVDVSRPSAPAVTRSIVVDGRYVDARLVDGRARVVITSATRTLPFVFPSDGSARAQDVARQANEEAVRRSTIDDWLPRVHAGDAPPEDPGTPLVACDRLEHPKEFSGFETLSVLSLDLGGDALDTTDTVGLVAGGEVAYASERSLFVATTARPDPALVKPGATPPGTAAGTGPGFAPPIAPVPEAPPTRSAIHAFAIDGPGPAAYRVSGLVDGTVDDRWSLSEHEGHLRVVSTTGAGRGGRSCPGCEGTRSQVSVLAERDGALVVVGTAGDMGRGEQVKAVRFLGDRGYVVTFRQTDPFYVLDLADPAHPRVVGELKVPGYSAYLHPVGGDRVLGVGQDATDQGRVKGLKVALYDVSDPAKPREIAQQVLEGTASEVERDSRAFLWWEPTRLAVVPVTGALGGRRPPAGAVGYRVEDAGVQEVGRIQMAAAEQPDGRIRSLVVGDRVLTVAASGLRTSSLDTLQDRGWLAL